MLLAGPLSPEMKQVFEAHLPSRAAPVGLLLFPVIPWLFPPSLNHFLLTTPAYFSPILRVLPTPVVLGSQLVQSGETMREAAVQEGARQTPPGEGCVCGGERS